MSRTKAFTIEIADISRLIFSGKGTKLVAPASYGEVCILNGHTPLLTELTPGEIRLQPDTGVEQIFYVSGGYMEVQPHKAFVLADQILRSSELDQDAALKAKQHAEALLESSPLPAIREESHHQIMKAVAQLRVIQHLRSRHSTKGR